MKGSQSKRKLRLGTLALALVGGGMTATASALPPLLAQASAPQADRVIVRNGRVIRRPSTPAERRADAIQLAAETRQEASERAREQGEAIRDAMAVRSPGAEERCRTKSKTIVREAVTRGRNGRSERVWTVTCG